MAGHLLRAPIASQQRFDLLEIGGGEAPVTARTRASAGGLLDRLAGPIGAVEAGAVTPELTGDRAAVAAEGPGDLGLVEALRSQRSNTIPLPRGDLVIAHWNFPFLGG